MLLKYQNWNSKIGNLSVEVFFLFVVVVVVVVFFFGKFLLFDHGRAELPSRLRFFFAVQYTWHADQLYLFIYLFIYHMAGLLKHFPSLSIYLFLPFWQKNSNRILAWNTESVSRCSRHFSNLALMYLHFLFPQLQRLPQSMYAISYFKFEKKKKTWKYTVKFR